MEIGTGLARTQEEPRMAQEDQRTISLREAYAFAISKGLSEEVAEIRGMEIEWDRSYTSSVRRGFVVRLLQETNNFEEFIEKCWQVGKSSWGESKIRRLLRLAADYETYLSNNNPEEGSSPEEGVDS